MHHSSKHPFKTFDSLMRWIAYFSNKRSTFMNIFCNMHCIALQSGPKEDTLFDFLYAVTSSTAISAE